MAAPGETTAAVWYNGSKEQRCREVRWKQSDAYHSAGAHRAWTAGQDGAGVPCVGGAGVGMNKLIRASRRELVLGGRG